MEIIYSLEFDERAHRDLKNLDGSIRKQIQEKLEKIMLGQTRPMRLMNPLLEA
jgi:mRNA-degrading endonuclease RelE of RelBE toxin-antitoxin system